MTTFFRTPKALLIVPVAAGLIFGGIGITAIAAQGPASSETAPKPNPKNVAAGEAEAKRLLLLMDRDKSGKVSKAEFIAYMEAEFARLDKNNDGELDVKELTGSQLILHTGPHR
jgi:LPS O-antigen subunit length determinant protein (WzzB/FepE family)